MYKASRIPALNPLRLIPANDSLPADFATWPFDRGFYEDQIRSWELKTSYQQKWNLNDRIYLYIDSLATSLIVHLVNEDGRELGTPLELTGTAIADNNAPNGDPYLTYYTSFRLEDIYELPVDLDQQIFYFVVEHVYGDPGDEDSIYHVSEPQFFRRKGWDDTVLIEYSNDETDYDVYFETLNNLFKIRVEGFVKPDEFGAHDTAFEDQQYFNRKLQSIPTRVYQFALGGYEGMPDYIRDKVNCAFSCDRIRIDGIRFSKDTGAKWSSKAVDGYPKRLATIQLQEYNPGEGTTSVTGGIAYLLALPMLDGDISFPFAINGVGMGDGVSFPIDSTERTIEDLSSLTSYIGVLNSFFASANGLTGTFAVLELSGVKYISYNNGIGETYHALSIFFAWDKHVSLGVAITGESQNYEFSFAGAPIVSAGSLIIVDWGDGIVEPFSSAGTGGVDYGATSTASHIYAGAVGDTEYNLRVFHAGTSANPLQAVAYFGFEYASANARIYKTFNSATIVAPTYLRVYSQKNQAIYGSGNEFDYRFLLACQANLKKLILNDSNISHFTVVTMPIPYSPPAGPPHWMVLKVINFNGNHLIASELDDFVVNTYFHLLESLGGFMDLRQSPAAVLPVTGTCGTRLAALTSIYAWTILYDT